MHAKIRALSLTTALIATIMVSASLAEEADTLEPIVVGQPQRIEVFPEAIKLTGPRQRVQLVVTGHYADGTLQDLTRAAEFASSNEQVVSIVKSVAAPHGDGSADVVVTVGGQTAKVPSEVSGYGQAEPVSFNYGALVALSKQGCNAGACHGSPSGKGGFRMSLRAFDPKLDELTLIHEEFGRRTNPLDPDNSLLLRKPLMKVPHGGGKKLSTSDPAYRVLHDWIAEGCRTDAADAPRCVKLEVYPPSGRVLKRPAHTQQLSVRTHFSDGSIRDVTPLAVYTSSDEQVASVNVDGLVIGKDRGEIAVVVRYLEFIETTYLTFVRDVEGFVWNDPPANNYIDELVYAKLQQLKFLPSETCTDDEFVRRVYLDVIGVLPTAEESRHFLEDQSPDKRAKLIDELLERPEFSKFWALKWGDVLRMTVGQVGGEGVHKYHRWVERAIEQNMPYDQFARELLTASGSTLANPPANFYRTSSDTNECVETVSQIFLGARLQCAKCHNHPFERWTQDNYYGMAAFFNRLQRTNTRRPDEMLVSFGRAGEVTQPRTGQQMKPWLPEQGDVDPAAESDRRDIFVEWLTQPDNPFFAKVEVNRIWSHLAGRGIVDPADDFRDSNPPSNAALLDALSKDFVEHGFDRKHVIRTILNSRTYQASSRTNEFNKDDSKYFSHYEPRMLSAEQLLDAICHVTAVPESFGSLPPGTKATQLPSPDIAKNDFLKIFGQPERQTVCACERSTESNLSQALQLYNGPLVHGKLRAENNHFRQLLAANKSDDEIVGSLYQAALCRQPSEAELDAARRHIAAKDEQIAAHNAEIDAQIAAVNKQITDVRASFQEKLLDGKLASVPEPIRADLKTALSTPADKRNDVQKYLVEKLGAVVQVTPEEVEAALDEAAKKSIADAQTQLAELPKQKRSPGSERIAALEDICWAVLNMNEFLFQH